MLRLISNILMALIITALSYQTLAFENDFVMRAGFAFSESVYNSLGDDGDEIDKDESYAAGAHTAYSYKWKFFETGVESRITLGKSVNLIFENQGQSIEGEGRMRTVDISPYIRFNTRTFKVPGKLQEFFTGINISPWQGYFKVGPSWMLQTINLDKFNIAEEFREDHKLTYESFGLSITLGLEEDTPYKDMHPVYFEVSASAYSSYKVSLVDKSDSKEINILDSRDADQNIKTFSLTFILGMALF